jgi:hypothetical protein
MHESHVDEEKISALIYASFKKHYPIHAISFLLHGVAGSYT